MPSKSSSSRGKVVSTPKKSVAGKTKNPGAGHSGGKKKKVVAAGGKKNLTSTEIAELDNEKEKKTQKLVDDLNCGFDQGMLWFEQQLGCDGGETAFQKYEILSPVSTGTCCSLAPEDYPGPCQFRKCRVESKVGPLFGLHQTWQPIKTQRWKCALHEGTALSADENVIQFSENTLFTKELTAWMFANFDGNVRELRRQLMVANPLSPSYDNFQKILNRILATVTPVLLREVMEHAVLCDSAAWKIDGHAKILKLLRRQKKKAESDEENEESDEDGSSSEEEESESDDESEDSVSEDSVSEEALGPRKTALDGEVEIQRGDRWLLVALGPRGFMLNMTGGKSEAGLQ